MEIIRRRTLLPEVFIKDMESQAKKKGRRWIPINRRIFGG